MDLKTFAARLKELREGAGLSQKELAERAGVSQRAISHWEQGLHEPGLLAGPALAAALGVELDALFVEPESIPEPKRGRPKGKPAETPADQVEPEKPPAKKGKRKKKRDACQRRRSRPQWIG